MAGERDAVEVRVALARALFAERLRAARLFNELRFLGVTVYFALGLFAGVALGLPDWQPDFRVFFVYWLMAGALWFTGRRSDRVVSTTGLGIAFVDMPAVTALSWAALRTGPVGYVVATNAALLVLFIIGSLAALDVRVVVLAGAIAATAQTALSIHGGNSVLGIVFGDVLMVFAVLGCAHTSGRVLALAAEATAEQLRRARLGRYFSPEVATMLAERGTDEPTGESREVTVLFADLRHFTALAERLPGPAVVALLNAYHERMVRTIFAFGGTLDKFLGDGLMVYFGAPVAQVDHPTRAARCAVAMQAELERWNVERTVRGEEALHMGIGIHTGTVVIGSIGTRERREFTVIGDTVNVAARLQELTKTSEAPILVSAATRGRLGDDVAVVPHGATTLRGRARPLDVYRVAVAVAGA
jgi:adenylate cyclase